MLCIVIKVQFAYKNKLITSQEKSGFEKNENTMYMKYYYCKYIENMYFKSIFIMTLHVHVYYGETISIPTVHICDNYFTFLYLHYVITLIFQSHITMNLIHIWIVKICQSISRGFLITIRFLFLDHKKSIGGITKHSICRLIVIY